MSVSCEPADTSLPESTSELFRKRKLLCDLVFDTKSQHRIEIPTSITGLPRPPDQSVRGDLCESSPTMKRLLFQTREEEAAALREELERWHRDAAGGAGPDGVGALGAAAVAGDAEGEVGTLHQQLRAAQEKEALLLEAYEQLERDQEKELAAGGLECNDS